MKFSHFLFVVFVNSAVILKVSGGICSKEKHNKYRSYDGFCNNLYHPSWGMSETAQRRFSDNNGLMIAYEDGVSHPRGGMNPSSLPSARLVSNRIHDGKKGPSREEQLDKLRSAAVFGHGQALAHDLVHTMLQSGVQIGDIDCCDHNAAEYDDPNICFPITIPEDEDIEANHFRPRGCLNFLRAVRAADNSESKHREQINLSTSFCDASFLYGSTTTQANRLRVKDSYLMKTDDGNDLPTIPKQYADFCVEKAGVHCPFAGDSRVSDIPTLTLNHLVWLREHNRIAEKLHTINQHWDYETVFQEARKIVIAMWQHVTYNAYLPKILGETVMQKYNLYSTCSNNDTYNPEVDPSIRNGFAAAPMRLGHTQLKNSQSFLSHDYKNETKNKIKDNFFCPHLVKNRADDIARWMTYTEAMKFDNFIVDGLRNKLFSNFEPAGDLISRNIQRGRDQGVPGYNRWREFCGLQKLSFEEFGDYGNTLKELYANEDDIDLFVGGVLEKGENGEVGETFACILAKQFQLFKKGDRFWYERENIFTPDQLESIKSNTLLSKLMCRHFNLYVIQTDVFTPGMNSHRLSYCLSLPEINLLLWKDTWKKY